MRLKAFKRSSTLRILPLSNNNSGDDGCRHLAAALEMNKFLTALELARNNFGNEGCFHLAAGLERNKSLTTLDLSSNNIGADGAAAFQTMLQSNYTLDLLYGVDGVEHILERNREIRSVRKRKVWWHFASSLLLAHIPLA